MGLLVRALIRLVLLPAAIVGLGLGLTQVLWHLARGRKPEPVAEEFELSPEDPFDEEAAEVVCMMPDGAVRYRTRTVGEELESVHRGAAKAAAVTMRGIPMRKLRGK